MRFAILAGLSVLSACAAPGGGPFPSLATRPGERVEGTIAPPPLPPPPPATAATGSRLAQLREQALAAHRKFEGEAPRADALSRAAQGAGVASEAWSVAQVALASLESARSQAMVAMADLDSLYVAAKADAVPTGGSGDVDAIGATRDEVSEWIGREDGILAAYRGRLRE